MILGPVQGHSYQEMSDILEVSVTVIKGRLHRARESLRSAFKDMNGEKQYPPVGNKTGSGKDATELISTVQG